MAITRVRGITGTGREVAPREMSELSASITRIELETDDPRIPAAVVFVDAAGNDEVRYFQRTSIRMDGEGTPLRVPVLEIRVKGVPVRLYLHPSQGPILSTQDLYF